LLNSSSSHLPLHSFPTRRSSDLRSADRGVADEERLPAGRGPPVQFPRHADAALERRRRLPGPGRRTQSTALLQLGRFGRRGGGGDRKSTRLNSSHVSISYAVFCL